MPGGGRQVTNSGTNNGGSSYTSYSGGGYSYSNPSGSRYYNTGSGHGFYNRSVEIVMKSQFHFLYLVDQMAPSLLEESPTPPTPTTITAPAAPTTREASKQVFLSIM